MFLDANKNKLPDIILARKKVVNSDIKGKKLKRLFEGKTKKENKEENEEMMAFLEEINDDKYCVEIGKKVGAVLRTQMLRRAKEMNISVTNQKSKKVERLEKRVKKAN